jgi:hypothetical protein
LAGPFFKKFISLFVQFVFYFLISSPLSLSSLSPYQRKKIMPAKFHSKIKTKSEIRTKHISISPKISLVSLQQNKAPQIDNKMSKMTKTNISEDSEQIKIKQIENNHLSPRSPSLQQTKPHK